MSEMFFLRHGVHAYTVQHFDMPFAPSDREMLDARFLCGSWASCHYYTISCLLSVIKRLLARCGITGRQVAVAAELRAGDGREDEGTRRRTPRHDGAEAVRRAVQWTPAAARQSPRQHRLPPTSHAASGAATYHDTLAETGEQVRSRAIIVFFIVVRSARWISTSS